MSNPANITELLEEQIRNLPLEELPRLLGQLLRAQALLLARLPGPPNWLERANYMASPYQQLTDGAVPRAGETVPSLEPRTEPLLDVEQAAKHLGMSAKWLYRNYRRLPHVLMGDGKKPRIRFRRCDLDAWVARHRMQ